MTLAPHLPSRPPPLPPTLRNTLTHGQASRLLGSAGADAAAYALGPSLGKPAPRGRGHSAAVPGGLDVDASHSLLSLDHLLPPPQLVGTLSPQPSLAQPGSALWASPRLWPSHLPVDPQAKRKQAAERERVLRHRRRQHQQAAHHAYFDESSGSDALDALAKTRPSPGGGRRGGGGGGGGGTGVVGAALAAL